MNMNLKGIMQTLGAKPGQVMSDPYARAWAPTPSPIKEAEGEDHEVSMAQNSLDTIIKMTTELKAKMGENEKEIPAWIQDHIAKAENLISQASSNYHEYGTNEAGINGADRFPTLNAESVNEAESYDGPMILKTGDKNLLKVGEKITFNKDGKKKEYKVVKSNGNGDFVLHIVESVNEGKFKKDDLVYNTRTKTVGIVRLGDDKYGEVKTDADGNVNVDELEKYNPIKHKHQQNAKVAPSTEKEVNSRGLFNPFKTESLRLTKIK
jgi:hypothetical protein